MKKINQLTKIQLQKIKVSLCLAGIIVSSTNLISGILGYICNWTTHFYASVSFGFILIMIIDYIQEKIERYENEQ